MRLVAYNQYTHITKTETNMKFLIITALATCLSSVTYAQSEWERPTSRQESSVKPQEKSGQVKVAKESDLKYIEQGSVPEVDGKIVFSKDFNVSGKNAQEIYDKVYGALDSLARTENQIKSGIVLINKKEHIIAARYSEWLEFSRSFISLDRTKFNYTIIATCSDGKLNLRLERITYRYEEGRVTGFRATAEELIGDKNAVNKKRTRLNAGAAKFRRKTIDRKNEIFDFIDSELNK